MKVIQDSPGGANERRAKGGKRIEVTSYDDPQPVYIDMFGPGRVIYPANFVNLTPPPSALDSIWQALWKMIKAAW